MNKLELGRVIVTLSYLTGNFVLRGGATSSFYWDKYRFESDPSVLKHIAIELVKLLPPEVERIAGLEMGAIPLATAISLQTGVPALFVRKVPKQFGTKNLVEGGFTAGDRAVIVEDVVTSGGQICESLLALRELGIVVQDVIAVIDREQGGRAAVEKLGCSFKTIFTLTELDSIRVGS